MTKEYVEMVGRVAYVWGWPLVNNMNRAAALANLPEPGRIGGVVPVAPPGSISMLTDYIDAAEKFVACPNQDTVYGAGYQRLDSQPVIVQVPDFDERFYTYQLTDARTDSFASLGVRILVDPADPEDIKQVHALQDSITVTQPGGPGRFEVPTGTR